MVALHSQWRFWAAAAAARTTNSCPPRLCAAKLCPTRRTAAERLEENLPTPLGRPCRPGRPTTSQLASRVCPTWAEKWRQSYLGKGRRFSSNCRCPPGVTNATDVAPVLTAARSWVSRGSASVWMGMFYFLSRHFFHRLGGLIYTRLFLWWKF